MKRFLIAVLAALIMTAFASCAKPGAGSDESAAAGPEGTSSSVPGAASPLPSEAAESSVPSDKPAGPTGPTPENTGLFHHEGTHVTFLSCRSGQDGYVVSLRVENGGDKTVGVKTACVSVNGWANSAEMCAEVGPGGSSDCELCLSADDLELCGIETPEVVRLRLVVYDPETCAELSMSEPIKIRTPAYTGRAFAFDETGEVLLDGYGTMIISKGFTGPEDRFLLLMIANTTGWDLLFSSEDVFVNGCPLDELVYSLVPLDAHALVRAEIPSAFLEMNGITEIEELTLRFTVTNPRTGQTIESSKEITVGVH